MRYYGWYSHCQRGPRAKSDPAAVSVDEKKNGQGRVAILADDVQDFYRSKFLSVISLSKTENRMAKILGKPLEPQWKKIFKKRTFKTGVSETLRKFDGANCFKSLQAKTYHRDQVQFKDLVAFWSQLEGLSNYVKALKEPKLTPWTSEEKKFLQDLRNELNGELVFWQGTNIKFDPRQKK
ncbi:MAG: hypothetical protein KJ000_19705 [Pirellulaceae bacterium]|nr:hypothetical protein [Pirellulaceae bacterium]